MARTSKWAAKLGLAQKLYGVFALMAVTTIALAGLLAVSTEQRATLSADYDLAASGALGVEKINGLIYAVVMESRGVYMSPDTKTAKPYADGIVKLNKTIVDVVDEWKKRVREDDAAAFDTFAKRISDFVRFRNELARLGIEVSPSAGREWGDNDANRTVRRALNSDLDALSKVYSERVRRISQDIDALNARNLMFIWIAIGFTAIVAAFGVMTIAFGIVRPLDRLSKIMRRVAADEVDIEIEGHARSDEIGAMAQSVVVFRDAAVLRRQLEAEAKAQREAVAEQQRQASEQQRKVAAMEAQVAEERAQTAARQADAAAEQAQLAEAQSEEQNRVIAVLSGALRELAAGNLTARIGSEMSGGYLPLREGYNSSIEQLSDTLKAIVEGLKEISIAAEEIAMSTTDLSQRTEEQSAGLEETTASMQQIMEAVNKNVEQARHATQIASTACEVAGRGGKVATDAVEAMSRIDQSSKEITQIVSVIDEIARQTNLLALNAAVEAARAGDAGRGFAVVASEVRSLAIRSSNAAKEINELIVKSDLYVKNGVEMVNSAGKSLNEIGDWVKQVADIVTAIDGASGEQAGSIAEINTALSQMDEVTQKNSALVEENAAATKTLEHHCASMNERIAQFKLTDDAQKRERGDRMTASAAA